MVGYDLLTPLFSLIFGESGFFSSIPLSSVLSVLHIMWVIFVVVSYLVSFLFIYLYMYASISLDRLSEFADGKITAQEEAYELAKGGITKSDRLQDLQSHTDSNNPNDWKLAIIEADIILDEVLKQQGYAGTSLGERLRGILPSSLASLDDAWQAHKVRNQIAHASVDFVLTQKLARETIMQYERVFRELGVV